MSAHVEDFKKKAIEGLVEWRAVVVSLYVTQWSASTEGPSAEGNEDVLLRFLDIDSTEYLLSKVVRKDVAGYTLYLVERGNGSPRAIYSHLRFIPYTDPARVMKDVLHVWMTR